jgi:cytochrome c oxidase subunit 5b
LCVTKSTDKQTSLVLLLRCATHYAGVTGRIPDEDEQSTGIERKELNKMLEGVEDPFGMAMEPKFGPRGTRTAPRMIPSHFDSRLVGICDEGSEAIHYFELKASAEPVYVNGEYFKLYKVTEDVHP